MDVIMTMQHLRLDSVVDEKEEVPVVDRAISRDLFQAHYRKAKVGKHFAV